MNRTARRLFTMGLLALSIPVSVQAAWENPFERSVQRAFVSGHISLDDAFLLRFAYLFAPETLSAVTGEVTPPSRTATALVRAYQLARSRLSPATVQTIDGWLQAHRAAHTYDTEHYRISYDTEGFDSVPLEDADGTGIPDYVEHLGDYAEYAWGRTFEDLGFRAPKRSPAQGHRLHIIVQQMNAYGMTLCTGFCTIRIENDFAGFPSNDDPDGPVAGAAKVTIAHELKHTSQWETSNMTELGWIETDATWMEDVVYPEVNDYIHYVDSSESQVMVPTDPLDKWLYGSYADAIWQISMSDRFGADIIVDLWDYRARHRAEGMLTSYDAILQAWGTDLVSQFCFDYMVRNYLTGTRTPPAGTGVPAYPDAGEFPEGPVIPLLVPDYVQYRLPHLAGLFFEAAPDDRIGAPTVVVESDPDATIGITAVLWDRIDGITLETVAMENGRAELRIAAPWSRLETLGIVIANGERAAPPREITLSLN